MQVRPTPVPGWAFSATGSAAGTSVRMAPAQSPVPVPATAPPVVSGAPSLPSAPAFGSRSVAEVFPSAAASLGLEGFENRLNLPQGQRICVIVADGLGRSLLKQKLAHTPFLRSLVVAGQGAV